MRGTEIVDEVKDMDDQATLCRRVTEEAVDFIKTNREQPFFVYVPHAFAHHPRKASKEFMDRAGPQREFDEQKMVMDSRYARAQRTQAQIEEIDWSVGRILDSLRELGLSEKTLVLFTSDNGGASGSSNAPLRGGKGSAWEGGLREPTVVWWPGTIPAESVCDEVATAMDLMPTFVPLAGAAVPNDRIIDGKDILPLLLARPGAKSPHDRFFYHQGNNLRAVRSGPWKLFRKGQLYNLNEDIGETTDVAAAHPEIVKRLTGYMDEFEAEITKNARPVGVAKNPRTLLPRPGVEGDEAYAPTLSLPRPKR
jgi:arylsulfatase A-like enzyme